MTLIAPNLDDRRFQDLVDDAKRLVQQRCPEWTDHNVSDPGVTLIETFAFMTDQLLYRLNRVPDRLYLKFLDLIGMQMRPATPSVVPVTFWLSAPTSSTMVVHEATRVATARTETDEAIVFTTTEDLDIVPCRLQAVRTQAAGSEETQSILDSLLSRVSMPMFSEVTQVGDTLLIGLDQAIPKCVLRLDFSGRVEGIGVDPRHPPLEWEAWTGDRWAHCGVSTDETGGFNRSGVVMVHVPRMHERSVIDGEAAAWIRVRVVDHGDDYPRYRSSPIIDSLAASTAGGTQDAIHAQVLDRLELGVSDGTPGQAFDIGQSLLHSPDAVVETSSQDGWETWQQVEHFAGSGPEDRHFVLDPAAGRVLFGPAIRETDGSLRRYGATPHKGIVLRLGGHRAGGGRHGNVPIGAVETLRSSIPFIARVENLRAAQGGVDGESLEEAKARAPLQLRRHDRAVTVEDFESFAREAAPDAARLHCVASDSAAENGVKILVVPAAPTTDGKIIFEELVPRQDILDRIAKRLDDVRLIGTRVLVEPPLYRGITVVARIRARAQADISRVRTDSLKALYTFLSPLPGGGPDGAGWPFGRPAQMGEVFAVLQRVPGVDLVEDVRLFAANPVTGERGAQNSRFEIEPHSLVFSFDHQVRVEQ